MNIVDISSFSLQNSQFPVPNHLLSPHNKTRQQQKHSADIRQKSCVFTEQNCEQKF